MHKEEDFLGLTKKGSQDLADKKNLIFRLIRVDDKNMFAYPTDKRDDRVCIEIDKGKVTKVTFT